MKRRDFMRNSMIASALACSAPNLFASSPLPANAAAEAGLDPDDVQHRAASTYAAYVHGARFDEFPQDVREKAKYLILDSVGCALGATQTQEGQANIKLSKVMQGRPESTVIGGGIQNSPWTTTFVNSQLANMLDFDDTWDVYPPGHPGCLIVPAALAVGESLHASGLEVLTAVVLGYEITMRVGRAVGSILWMTGAPSLPDQIGPAVVTNRLLGADEATVERTFGVLALDFGPRGRLTFQKYDVPSSMDLDTLKANMGGSAELGVLAGYKAKSGLVGMSGLLDLDYTGWCMEGLLPQGYGDLTRGLGREHWILKMSFKPTPSCRWTHVPITAAWSALGNRPVRAAEIDRVIVRGVNRLERYQWERMLQAQFSNPCALALAMTGATPGPGWYTSGRFRDADIRELASKVRLERDPEAEAREINDRGMTCTVEIKFKTGEVKSARCEHVKGAPGNPMSGDELVAKFKTNASHLKPGLQQQIIETILHLETVSDIASLMGVLG
jgi:2-methylcitrate dehydratase PrpD